MCVTGKSMGQKRFTTAAAELNGSIYVTGGYDEQYLSSTERLDPREGRWVSVHPPPPTPTPPPSPSHPYFHPHNKET